MIPRVVRAAYTHLNGIRNAGFSATSAASDEEMFIVDELKRVEREIKARQNVPHLRRHLRERLLQVSRLN